MIADFLVNYTMDLGESWRHCNDWPCPGRDIDDCRLVIHSDGGTRARNCSASAWVAEILVDSPSGIQTHRLASGGTYINNPISSFLAEAMALEESTLFICKLLNMQIVQEPLGKRMRRI